MSRAKVHNRLRALLDCWQTARTSASEIVSTAAEDLVRASAADRVNVDLWHEFLHVTGKPGFLRSLESRDLRTSWAECCFEAIRLSGYTLGHMFAQRVSDHPERTLFQDMAAAASGRSSYRSVARLLREMAAVFHSIASPLEPRVAILADNCAAAACSDLACLCYDVLDTPLNVHFSAEILAGIFDRLQINIVLTDTEERFRCLQQVLRRTRIPFRILSLHPHLSCDRAGFLSLDKLCRQLGKPAIAQALERRRRFSLKEVATVMFSSGTTGEPKGISFSNHNLVTKRFARAAALPDVGDDEVLLCYLPLFHTFGRYLEMTGAIYWGGTYVFAGNPSFETIAALLPKVNPTGLVGVPLRWAQLRDRCLETLGVGGSETGAFRKVVGNRLRWGLSAAGYLDPKVFRFFIRNGVDLCSGFGMTEATGGITMTPPAQYIDDTHGLPLPGIQSRFRETGELEVSGPYIGRYLDDKGPGEEIPDSAGYWLATGDLFRLLPNGYYELVDRIKDIYKNDRGQTIAPLRVEKQFAGVPGIKRTFLVGDRRAYNVLLIVPDEQDPMLQASAFEENRREYFRRIIAAANRSLAPYERVVNYAILDRDFETARGELTAKESLNRKTIETNFAECIENLYRSDFLELALDGFRVWIPRWLFRDLSIVEGDLQACPSGLYNRSNGLTLPLRRSGGAYLVGDLEYSIPGDIVDLGLFARQPRLWIGNPSLIRFCPCKEGWDVPPGSVHPQIVRPSSVGLYAPEELPRLARTHDPTLDTNNHLICRALFCDVGTAAEAIQAIGPMLPEVDLKWNDIMRRRLETLARHPVEKIRCRAYQVLLLDEPTPDYENASSPFIRSGLSFLNQESIEAIANSRFEKRQLEALRRRLFSFREELPGTADAVTHNQFRDVFCLLSNFAVRHPEFYGSIRAELAAWSLHPADRVLADEARLCLTKLHEVFEASVGCCASQADWDWSSLVTFDDEVSPTERRRIQKLLGNTPFLRHSLMLTLEEKDFPLEDVADGGIWVSRNRSQGTKRCYRIGVNLTDGRHYDLEVTIGEDLRTRSAAETVLWWLAIAGHPYGPRVLPQPGCFHAGMHARSSMYQGALTAWDKIAQYSGMRDPGTPPLNAHVWKKLFVMALAAFFRVWRSSGRRIVPGMVSPGNVLVPELDYQEGAMIASLAGWRAYSDPLSLVRPMAVNFFERVTAHYPWCGGQLDLRWIYDACLEALGEEEGHDFLMQLRDRFRNEPAAVTDMAVLTRALDGFLQETGCYTPIHVHNATERYLEWKGLNPCATAAAREQTVEGLYRLYPLYRYPELVRYRFYRQTYFRDLDKRPGALFDGLLKRMATDRGTPAVHHPELSDLQDALGDEDREVFSRMVFPRMRLGRTAVLKIDKGGHSDVIVSSAITDRHGANYSFREPVEPREIGQLYRYFFDQNIPMAISEQDRHYVLIDGQERVVGGICYQLREYGVAQIDGIVVAMALQGRGVGSAMEEEFCNRMASQAVTVVRGHFLEKFYLKRGYHVSNRWGTLVKFLPTEYP